MLNIVVDSAGNDEELVMLTQLLQHWSHRKEMLAGERLFEFFKKYRNVFFGKVNTCRFVHVTHEDVEKVLFGDIGVQLRSNLEANVVCIGDDSVKVENYCLDHGNFLILNCT